MPRSVLRHEIEAFSMKLVKRPHPSTRRCIILSKYSDVTWNYRGFFDRSKNSNEYGEPHLYDRESEYSKRRWSWWGQIVDYKVRIYVSVAEEFGDFRIFIQVSYDDDICTWIYDRYLTCFRFFIYSGLETEYESIGTIEYVINRLVTERPYNPVLSLCLLAIKYL